MLTRSAMKRTGMKPAISDSGRANLVGRSRGWCEAQLHGCLGRATDVCHRRARQEGRDEQLSGGMRST